MRRQAQWLTESRLDFCEGQRLNLREHTLQGLMQVVANSLARGSTVMPCSMFKPSPPPSSC